MTEGLQRARKFMTENIILFVLLTRFGSLLCSCFFRTSAGCYNTERPECEAAKHANLSIKPRNSGYLKA